MKPKAPKKKDTKPKAKSGVVKQSHLLEDQYKSLASVIADRIIKDLDIDGTIIKRKPDYYHNGLPVYHL
jgi:hypothetical protein